MDARKVKAFLKRKKIMYISVFYWNPGEVSDRKWNVQLVKANDDYGPTEIEEKDLSAILPIGRILTKQQKKYFTQVFIFIYEDGVDCSVQYRRKVRRDYIHFKLHSLTFPEFHRSLNTLMEKGDFLK